MDLQQKDRKYLGRDFPAPNLEITGAKGNYQFGPDGKKYIDFIMGWCVGNIGWGVPEVEKVIRDFDGPDYVNPFYLYKPWTELAELLVSIAPGKLTKSFRATGGTEAVEIALQAAMRHTKRYKFVSTGAYHGHSIGAMSVGYPHYRKTFPNLLIDCKTITPPFDEEAAKQVEEFLSHRDVAAVITEPIVFNLGIVIPTQEFFDRVSAACKKYGTLLIIDEVATGFGRTGKLFASEWYGLEPDIMTFAKGLTGGYGTLGATLMTEAVAKSMEVEMSFYSTFGWQPRNVIATLANLRYLLKHKSHILKNTLELSSLFEKRLRAMHFRYPAEIRVKGLAIGIEFRKEGYAVEIVNRAINKGLLVSELGPLVLTLFPALTLDKKTANQGLDILESCL